MAAYGATDRISYVCDSFSGLPPGDRSLDKKDKNWDQTPYLEVSSEIVAGSFKSTGFLTTMWFLLKVFLMRQCRCSQNTLIALMRLDVSCSFAIPGYSHLLSKNLLLFSLSL